MNQVDGDRAATRAAFRAERRRRALTLLPGTAVVFWALADLVAGRFHRLSALDAGFIRHVTDHIQPVAWTLAFVLIPYLVAVKPKPKRTGAVVALFTGPVLTPLLFGAGGWRLWQIAVLAGLVLWIESRDQPRVGRRRPAAEPATFEEDFEPAREVVTSEMSTSSFQEMSAAPFQRRSSS